ncbi:IMP cyclohydrolase [Prevotella veroralis]
MAGTKQIKTALISVFHKDGLDDLLKKLHAEGVKFLSTGGTQEFIESLGYDCQKVEDVTSYPSILGGRVKTLHPKIFGGILARRDNESDQKQMAEYDIPAIDLVIVDLYPFEQTVASGASSEDIIEKIDIGGISLIRAGAKNFKDVVIIPSKTEYPVLLQILNTKGAQTDVEDRKMFAERAFGVSSHYDTAIHSWFVAE